MHLAPLIRDLSIILSVAALVTLIFERTKQPVVLGYIVAGIIVGPFTPPIPLVTDLASIKVWAELGVIFLMFSLGLEFSFRKLARVGGSATITAILEVLFMLLIGYQTGRFFGWKFFDSLFLGAMLSISSTTIIIKTFDELGLKTKRFAELVFGILIVEDLVAILLLVTLSTIAINQSISLWVIGASTVKLVLVVGGWFIFGYFLVPRFVQLVGDTGSEEMLTILSVSLCLLLVVLSAYFHYSVALGAFIMGSILAETKEVHRIETLIRPLRDMFAAIFFVSVGMLIDPSQILVHFWPVICITLVTIAGKIFSITLGALLTGQTLQSAVLVGFSLSQIGEFSFIIATLGNTLGVTSDFLYPIAVAVSILTTFTTPYLLKVAEPFAVILSQRLPNPMLELLNWYSQWLQKQSANRARSTEFYHLSFRWVLNGLIVTLIFLLTFDAIAAFFLKMGYSTQLSSLVAYLFAIFMSSPFLWAMSTMFNQFTQTHSIKGFLQHTRGIVNFASRLATILWLDLLSLRFFDAKIALVLTLLSVIGFFVFFYSKLEASYHWFEKNFLSTFNPPIAKTATAKPIPLFAPWDGHLVRLTVHPNSQFVGQSLQVIAMRSEFGVNVVAIQRDRETIVAPTASAILYPSDELLILGTDEQIERIRRLIEEPSAIIKPGKDLTEYQLRNILIPTDCPLVGKTIRESNLRETFLLIVVGVERGGNRLLNPDSIYKLEAQDILWVVGEPFRINLLEQELLAIPENENTLENPIDTDHPKA
jgi:CPA2 family monovalent cation:H+ antiporter-2